ncbi:hypothetical protein M885DRAFT_172413 [Pelagophyceae sp. CCMP2097]|nr:hypothetical protein M885DRAFT_172413 [Pelagophyceae sp. CCMP2097]
MRHAATCYNEIVSRAHARVAEASFDGGEGLKPWASLVGMVESAVEAAARPAASATSRQTAVAAAFVATLARGARSALLLEAAAYAPGASTVSARWSRAPAAATVAARQPWDAAGFFADERLRYAAHAQILHGSIVDPVSGEALDILSQCVSLRIEARDVELVDAAAFDDVLAAFGDRLPLQQRCWVKGAPGSVHRVNGDATHDVSQQTGPAETLLRDVKRKDIVTEPLLVIGEPAGGKTTFAKQLLAWALREPRHARLVPVLVRVCDVARFFRAEAGGCADAACLVWEFLRRTTPEVRCKLYDAARAERRLLLVLDGLDEAGALHDRLEREVRDEYQHHPLVLTSRDMKALSSATFARFRRVRMLQLSRAQIYAVAERRLGTARADDFAAALRGSAALQRMAVNPLLLSITLAVFTKTDGTSAGAPAVATMNRGLVYSIAVDSMLGTLGDADAAAGNARLLLRRIAWLAHSADGGDGARDWDDALVDQALGQLYDDKLAELQAAAVAQCGGSAAEVWRSAAVCAAAAQQHRDGLGRDWLRTSAAAQRGRLPLLAWFSERGEDKYRFAHLTFQEFFCAEHAFLDFEAACEKGPDAVAQLCARLSALVLRGRGPAELFQRGWWQQVVQICCDVARSRGRRDVAQHLGAALLGLGGAGAGAVALEACVGERNAATLAALLGDTAGAARALSLTNGELGAAACALLRAERCFGAALGRVDLSGNLLDARAALSVAAALSAARCPLRTLDVGANRMCVGSARRPGFERETYHSGKQGGSARSKLYVDYMHAAWIPDLSGIEALVALALEMRATLTALDVRSNALTVDAGNLLAALLPEAGGASRLRELCGINVAALCGDGVADLAFGPDLDGVQPLLVGQKVEARFGGEEGRVFYPALVEAVVQGGAGGAAGPAAYDVAYIDETGGVIRREAAVPRCLVRDGARAGSRRLEAGGCLVLAAALERASPRARSRLRVLRLAHQGIAFDMSVWNHGQGEAGDVPLESGPVGGPRRRDDGHQPGGGPAAAGGAGAVPKRAPRRRSRHARRGPNRGARLGGSGAAAGLGRGRRRRLRRRRLFRAGRGRRRAAPAVVEGRGRRVRRRARPGRDGHVHLDDGGVFARPRTPHPRRAGAASPRAHQFFRPRTVPRRLFTAPRPFRCAALKVPRARRPVLRAVARPDASTRRPRPLERRFDAV